MDAVIRLLVLNGFAVLLIADSDAVGATESSLRRLLLLLPLVES